MRALEASEASPDKTASARIGPRIDTCENYTPILKSKVAQNTHESLRPQLQIIVRAPLSPFIH